MKMTGAVPVVLMAAYPVLFLYSHNANQTDIYVLWAPLAAAIGTALFAWGIVFVLLKDRHLSTLLVTLGIVLFYSYGHVHNALLDAHLEIGRNRYLLPLWTLAFVFGAVAITRNRDRRAAGVQVLKVVATVLMAQSLFPIGDTFVRHRIAIQTQYKHVFDDLNNIKLVLPESPPDIYYIILDGHAGSDILRRSLGYDNSAFMDSMVDRGFYVASRSHSNYPYTFLSIASSLNMAYLDFLTRELGPDSNDYSATIPLVRANMVGILLKAAGYRFVQFGSPFPLTQQSDIADELPVLRSASESDRFMAMLYDSTLAFPFTGELVPRTWTQDGHRLAAVQVLEEVPEAGNRDQPTFVFAHIIPPHPPYVFGANGEQVYPPEGGWKYHEAQQAYLDQLTYIDFKVVQLVDEILANSTVPPVIVIQGDHGWAWAVGGEFPPGEDIPSNFDMLDVFGILNAYYLPGVSNSRLYATISPVNTFRIIFNSYFDAELDILPDVSFVSDYDMPYDLIDVTDQLTH